VEEEDAGRRREDVALDGGLDDDLAFAFGAPLVAAATGAGGASGVTGGGQIDPFTGSSFTRSDRQLSETLINYWINFIRTGCVYVLVSIVAVQSAREETQTLKPLFKSVISYFSLNKKCGDHCQRWS